MRTYAVQVGDSPAQIAIRFAGCPKCAIDLIHANPHKESVRHPNGFLSFRELRAGESIFLPDKWFSEEFERLPPSYFASLPYPDGVTVPQNAGSIGADLVVTSEIAALRGVDPCLEVNALSVCAAQRSMGVATDGKYGTDTASVFRQYFPDAPPACSPRPAWWAPAGQSSCVTRAPAAAIVAPQKGLGTGTLLSIGALGAVAVGGIYYFTKHRAPRIRRVRYTVPSSERQK